MEVFKNSFDGGLDTNISQRLIPPNKYIQAANVNISADSNFYSLENIAGTTQITEFTATAGYEPLAVFANKYKIGDTLNVPCITVVAFSTTAEKLKIYAYAIGTDTLYELYEQNIDSSLYDTNDRAVDGVLYPENGIDILYFTDNFFKIRKLRCEIPSVYTANFLTELDVQMQRRGALGLVELDDIVEGGSVFTGSYQFAYQMINPDTNQFTKFSLFCNPVQVFLKPTDPFEVTVRSGIGLQSNYKIVLNINISEEEAAYYTHFRLAVLENIEPSGVLVETARLTAMESVADFLNGTTLEEVEYNANVRLDTINLTDIVVDLLALDHVKTLSVRQNRLVAGNVVYKSLDYDNGDPIISGGEVIKAVSPNTKNSFADPVFASKFRGHFRNECYRYAISYFDEDLNFSFPKVIDLTGVVFNQFGVETTIVTPNPELLLDPSFNGGPYWIDTPYTDDDPTSNPSFAIGGDAVVTFSTGPLSSNYMVQTLTLDNTKTYDYILNVSNTIASYVPYISFWNGGTKLSEFGASTSGSFTPPASTTGIGLRVFNVFGSGTFTYLDMSVKETASSVVIPPITTTGFDIKYPSRSSIINGETFTLFGEDGKLQSLGLTLEGIDNHPTWARGFVILRANRIKDILFQTPVIPMNKVYAVGALEEYPQLANELSGTGRRTLEYPSAQPMGPYTTYLPRNYHWNVATDINMFSTAGGATGGGLNKKFTGEAFLQKNTSYVLGMIFPPSFMYENKAFAFNPNFKAVPVDAMIADKDVEDFSDLSIGSVIRGRNIKTSLSSSFRGLSDDHYYYNMLHGGIKTPLGAGITLDDYKEFINFGEGDTVAGYNVFRYDKLETPGFFWGVKGNTHKSAVVKFSDGRTEINNNSAMVFAAGFQTARDATASQAFDTDVTRVQTFEIVNISAGLEDTRYGKVETPHEYIFTGTLVTFTEPELIDVRAGNSLPKDVDVWGGDCYVTPHLFKLTDTVYGVSNSEKFENIGGLDLTNTVRNWEKGFNDLETASEASISIPVPYKNAAQYLQVVMESEYNAGVIDNEIISTITTVNDDFPLFNVSPSSEGSCRVPLTYELNINHKKQNSDKIFRIKDPLLETNNSFVARLLYTDQKVYQTSISGFDIFRVLNFFDLEETYGPIHSLANSGDELYSLQQKAVTYIGVGERLLETTDALQLSVQSGSYIGNVMYIDVDRGTQHIKSVLETGNAVYFVDARNKTFNRLSNKSLDVISEATMASTFRDLFSAEVPEKSLLTLYDTNHKQVWVTGNQVDESFCYIYDEARGIWVSNYDFPDNSLFGSASTAQKLYLVEKKSSGINVHSAYTGAHGQLFGSPVDSSVTGIVNPNMEIAKTFDDLLVVASNPLREVNIIVSRPISIVTQSVLGLPLNVVTRGESNYRVKVLRDASQARLRGHSASVQLVWHNNGDDDFVDGKVQVPSFLTKYRQSENKF